MEIGTLESGDAGAGRLRGEGLLLNLLPSASSASQRYSVLSILWMLIMGVLMGAEDIETT